MARVELHHGQDYVIVDADDESLSDVAKQACDLLPEVVGDEREPAIGFQAERRGTWHYDATLPTHAEINGGIAPKGDSDG